MKNSKLRYYATRSLRAILVFGFVVGVIIFASNYAVSHSGGITGQTNKVGDGQGCTCHCANSNGATSVTLSTSATTFEANQTYTFTITVSNGAEIKGGCDIATQFGSLTAGNDGLQSSGGQLTHTQPKALPATWTFTYTAPSNAGVDTIFAAGNAVNNDGTNGNGNCTDEWNFATKYLITVTAPLRTLVLTKNTMNFGSKRVGGSYTDTLHLNSVGNATVSVSSQGMNSGQAFTNSPTGSASLTVGTSELQTITFAPTAAGNFNDSLVVKSDANNSTLSAPNWQGTAITGTGIQAVFTGQQTNPANTIVFGSVRVGQNNTMTYSFTNTGADTLFLQGPASIGGANASAFSIVSQPSQTVLPNASSSVQIKFSPTVKVGYTASLNMTALNNITIPQIAIIGTGSAPVLSVPDVTDIGTGRVNAQRNGTVQIENAGDAVLNISSITQSSSYESSKFTLTSGTSMAIQPNQTATMSVSYNPNILGRDTVQYTINCDDNALPTKQILVVGQGGLPTMPKLSIDTIKFGDVRVGGSAQNFSLSIGNTGTYDLTVLGIDVSPSQFTVVSKPGTVSAGSNGTVTLKCTPTVSGLISGMAIVRGDDANNPNDTVYLTANGTISNFDVPSGIAFGDVKLNSSRDTTVTLRNLGTAPVKILHYALTDPNHGFVLTDTVVHTIAAHDTTATITIQFNAFQELTYSGTLAITTDEAGSGAQSIQLSGRGVNSKLQLSVGTIDFGNVDSSKTAQKSFTITNSGTAPAAINSLSIAGSSMFAIDSPKTAFTIPASGVWGVLVSFNPVTGGSQSGTLTVNAAEGTSPQVLLSGIGIGDTTTTTGLVMEQSGVTTLLQVIPNPATTSAVLKIGVTTRLEDVELGYFDAAGRLLAKQSVGALDEGTHSVALALPPQDGVVFIRITDAGNAIGAVQIVITR